MGRRAALVAAAYVAYGIASSYALLAVVDPYYGGPWLVAFFALGTIASVAVGLVVARWWATLLPAPVVAAAAPAGDVLDQLPLVWFLLVFSPFAAALVSVGVGARRLARTLDRADAALATAALGLVTLAFVIATLAVPQTASTRAEMRALAYGYPVSFAYSDVTRFTPPSLPETYPFNPWESPTGFDDARFAASFAIVYAGVLTMFVIAVAAARQRSRASSGVSEPGSTR